MHRMMVVLAVAACGSAVPRSATPATDEIAFVDVTVVPMDRAGELAHQTVIVRQGRVAEVGPTASVTPGRGATTIDGRGKWLMPGLADMHVHTVDPQALALFVSMGVTTVRVMWGGPGSLGVREAIAKGEKRLAPAIITAGPIVDGDPPVWPGSLVVASAQQATAEVAREKDAGYDFVKVYNQLPVEAYRAIVAEAARRGMAVMGHVPTAVGLAGALDARQRTVEHLEGYAAFAQKDGSPLRNATDYTVRLGLFRFSDPAKLADAVARTKAAGTWNCPTLVVQDRVAHLDQADRRSPELAYVSKAAIASWDPASDFRFRSWGAEQFQLEREAQVWRMKLVKQLADAGAGILAGTDVGNPWLVPGFSLHQELELLVAAKLTPFEALRAATAGPAEMLGVQDQQGAVKKGVRADLVLLDADPLADIKNTQKIAGVMLRGTWMPEPELAKLRDEVAGIYAGTRSRFEAVASPATATFTARYTGEGGEQRISATGTGDALVIVGEMRLDEEMPARWQVDAGPGGTGRKLTIADEALELEAVRDGDRLHVTGTLGGSKLALDEPVAADELLAGAPLALDALLYRQLAKLAVGDKTTVKLAQVELLPKVGVHHYTIGAKRLEDATRTVGVKVVPVRRFEIRIDQLRLTFQVATDADGWPVETPEFLRVQ